MASFSLLQVMLYTVVLTCKITRWGWERKQNEFLNGAAITFPSYTLNGAVISRTELMQERKYI